MTPTFRQRFNDFGAIFRRIDCPRTGRLAVLVVAFGLCGITSFLRAQDRELPVRIPEMTERRSGVRNPISFDQMHHFVNGEAVKEGLTIDLGDSSLQGTIYTGPYPFEEGEADYDYARYRRRSTLTAGRGVLPIAVLFRDVFNANSWPEGLFPSTKAICYRLDLWRVRGQSPQHLGFYDGVVHFRREGGGFVKNLSIVEGPFVSLVTSENPGAMIVAFETDEPCRGSVLVAPRHGSRDRFVRLVKLLEESKAGDLEGLHRFDGTPSMRRHEIAVSGLEPQVDYTYMIHGRTDAGENVFSPLYHFRSAPPKGGGPVTLAYVGDSREGVGGGERTYMGCNHYILSRLANDAMRRGAEFFLFGGDLVNGHTTETEDFRLQLKGWKQAMSGFWRSRAVYPCMGNHEALLNTYRDDRGALVVLDQWPYATQSAEALFGAEFYNPRNGPVPTDARRPPYEENVFALRYGLLQVIAFNNNYWYSSHANTYGGAPEGYLLDDQLDWIEARLEAADKDPTVRYVLLFAQEPVFPCGGHVGDSMWYRGNNNVRAHTLEAGELVAEKRGIIEVRNRFWSMVSRCEKVAAVLSSDEHEYYRVLVDGETPVGVMPGDDHDGDGRLDACSPDPAFIHPVWQITVGTGGAPYYSRQKTPWEPVLLSSQHGYALIHADEQAIGLRFVTITGQVLDEVENLMEIKR